MARDNRETLAAGKRSVNVTVPVRQLRAPQITFD
jgi:hypothetical protein